MWLKLFTWRLTARVMVQSKPNIYPYNSLIRIPFLPHREHISSSLCLSLWVSRECVALRIVEPLTSFNAYVFQGCVNKVGLRKDWWETKAFGSKAKAQNVVNVEGQCNFKWDEKCKILRCAIPVVRRKTNGELNVRKENTTIIVCQKMVFIGKVNNYMFRP